MLDILIPINKQNLGIAQTCVGAIDKHTPGVPSRIVLAIDGSTQADRNDLEEFMRDRKPDVEPNYAGSPNAHQLAQPPPPALPNWIVVEWPGSVQLQGTIARGLEHVKGTSQGFLAIIPPWIELRDPVWFAKMQLPIAREGTTMAVTVPRVDNQLNKLPPAKFARRKMPGTQMVLTRPSIAREIVPLMNPVAGMAAWVNEFSRIADERGGTRWEAQSVRYFIINHNDHSCPQPERSGDQETKSELPSPTTPVSSSPTTTGAGGSVVSVPF